MTSQVSIGGKKTVADIQCVLADRTAQEFHAQWKLTIVTVLSKTLTLGMIILESHLAVFNTLNLPPRQLPN